MSYKKECVLMDRECINCGECDICDLDPTKICDNCCKCIDSDADYKGIYIDDIIDNDNDIDIDEDEIENSTFDEPVSEDI